MGRKSLSVYMKGYYEDFHALKAAKNKPNSKPIFRPSAGKPKL